MGKNYYDILGVAKTASEDELKKAYRTLSKKYHPDLQQGKTDAEKKEAEDKFKDINEAYSVLSDSQKRQKYDKFGTTDFNGMGSGPRGFDPMAFFRQHFRGDFPGFDFGFGGGSGQRSGESNPNAPTRGRDVETTLKISFKESIFGVHRTFEVKFSEKCSECNGTGAEGGNVEQCPTCQGTGMFTTQPLPGFISSVTCPKCHGMGYSVKTHCHVCHGSGMQKVNHPIDILIPKGVMNGERLLVRNEGEKGLNGGPNGNLYLRLEVEENSLFTRCGDGGLHIMTKVFIPSITVGLVDTVTVPTPYGTQTVKLPSKPKSDGSFMVTIPGCGVKRNLHGREVTGDLCALIIPEPISKLTPEQKKLAERLMKSLKDSNSPMTTEHNKAVSDYLNTFKS